MGATVGFFSFGPDLGKNRYVDDAPMTHLHVQTTLNIAHMSSSKYVVALFQVLLRNSNFKAVNYITVFPPN